MSDPAEIFVPKVRKIMAAMVLMAAGTPVAQAHTWTIDAEELLGNPTSDLSRISPMELPTIAEVDGQQFFRRKPHASLETALEVGEAHARQHHLRGKTILKYEVSFGASFLSLSSNNTQLTE
jgi:hypothetical protein